ncbi:hypothetical protein HPB52_005533 [Rhipicephalus sanguineus]|uniref:CCHC-type domain-containing protein n=1 Tax=Rhipicephalus sanguineus TaxID=34632 RepID=A0A9D4Q5I7_RHISA|nr:hypothetical protein HPB52_005533 [Rhipicephalus sanguineus]
MEVTVEGENVSREEFEDNTGWRPVGQRKPSEPMPEQRSEQPPIGESDKKQREQRLRQITRASRMPQLPREDYKIIVRPRGGLRVSDHGAARIANSVYQAADIPREAREQDTICPNYQQNIIVVSTPVEEHANRYQRIACIKLGTQEFEASAYEAAPENTSKGVIRGIPLDDTARDITANVITPRNPTALVAKRMGNTTNVIVLFDGYRVPSYVKYGGALIRCSLYRKQLDVCYHCGRLGHRADVCPNPNDKICRGCRMPNPPENHECKARCQLCDQDHPTADRTCKARYKTPFLNNQTIVAMREENKKLREEIHKYKNGKLQCSDATVITEDIVTSMEENIDSPFPKRKAVENNGEGTSKPKKTKTANMLHERQEEFQQRVDLRISQIEEAMKTQIESMNEIKETMLAQIKEWGTATSQRSSTH